MLKNQSLTYSRNENGSTFVVALLTIAVLLIAGAGVLRSVSTRYDYTHKAIGWSKALSAAESGVDLAIANCRRTLGRGKAAPWTGWKKYNGSFEWVPVEDGDDADEELSKGRTLLFDLASTGRLKQPSEGASELWFEVLVDAPADMMVNGKRWYRIRSTGYSALPGGPRAGYDRPDNPSGPRTRHDRLRKMDLINDHFIMGYGNHRNMIGSKVPVSPQATRRIEVIARPVTAFDCAIVSTAPSGTPMTMPLVDSYDSRDTINYPNGLYSDGPRNPETGVGCNGNVYVNSPISSLVTQVYGSVATNNGTLLRGDNITGAVDNQARKEIYPVNKPEWASPVVYSPTSTLVAGPESAPVYRSWSSSDDLTVKLPPGQTSGVANVYVDGNVTGGITVEKGVTLKLWFTGNFSMKARDIKNLNNNAAFLQLNGINPPAGKDRVVDINSGNPGYRYFVLNAPGHDFETNGNPDICGAVIARALKGNGNTTWHYDEALGDLGEAVDYTMAMWVEDDR